MSTLSDTPLLVVYTAIFGKIRDSLRSPSFDRDPDGRRVEFHCFTDQDVQAYPWKIWRLGMVVGQYPVQDPRRAARRIKTDPGRLREPFAKAQYSLWVDGSHVLKTNPWSMVDRHLQHADIAIAKHGERNCVYQEHHACSRMRKDNEAVMASQIERYRAAGYPEHNGLHETGIVLRRLNAATDLFNRTWSDEINAGSCRDQLSVDYAAWYRGMTIAPLPGSGRASPYFDFYPHR